MIAVEIVALGLKYIVLIEVLFDRLVTVDLLLTMVVEEGPVHFSESR